MKIVSVLKRKIWNILFKMINAPRTMKHRIKRFIFKTKVASSIFFNVAANRISKIFQEKPPGMSFLYEKNPVLPPRIKFPTAEQIQWTKEALTELQANKDKLKNKVFIRDL